MGQNHGQRGGLWRGGRLQAGPARRAAIVPLILGGAGLAVSVLVAAQAGAAVAAPRAAASAAQGNLNGVTCVSSKDCIAVGRAVGSNGLGHNLAERWNGKKWSATVPPGPAGSRGGVLNAVSCTSASNCIAVGAYDKSGDTTGAQADRWNGKKWSAIKIAPPKGSASLGGVACAGAKNCWAAGAAGNQTLIEHWNGKKWSRSSSPSPHPAKPNVLSGVACPSARECWAAGYSFPTNFTGSLTERWNGKKWAVASTPTSKSGQLIGDACGGTSACVAVGIGDSLFPLAQHWTGKAWKTTAVAKVSKEQSGELNGAACHGRTSCVAVGSYFQGKATLILTEKWNGSHWSATKAKGPAGTNFASLNGAACASAGNCWAVGIFFGKGSASFPLIEHWNGKTWQKG
jgi:hypothetical protein